MKDEFEKVFNKEKSLYEAIKPIKRIRRAKRINAGLKKRKSKGKKKPKNISDYEMGMEI